MMEEDEKNMLWGNMPFNPSPMQPPPMMRRPDSSDDRHVIAKHGQIYPTDEQLASIQKQVQSLAKKLAFWSIYLINWVFLTKIFEL